jgi:hypothetical protein
MKTNNMPKFREVLCFPKSPSGYFATSLYALHSQNPYCTALFCTVPPNRIFLGALDSKKIRDQKSKIRNTFPSQPFLTLFNLAQVLEIPLFPGFSRKLFKKSSIPPQSTFPPSAHRLLRPILHSAIATPHSPNPHGTAVFCTVLRNSVFFGVNISLPSLPPASSTRPTSRTNLPHVAKSLGRQVAPSSNPYCTALFCTVPRNPIFSSSSRCEQIRNQKSNIRN